MKRIVVLISGRGSNLKAIIDGIKNRKIDGEISLVLSDKQNAKGLKIASENGIKTEFIDPSIFYSRREYDLHIAKIIKKEDPDIIVLAGYMRILSDEFIDIFEGKIVNIHPSLIPAFAGKNAQKQAIEFGSLVTGCSVHFVTKELDRGPVIIQAAVPILPQDTEETLSERILSFEHRIYPQAIKWILESRVIIDGRKAIVENARYGTLPVNPQLEDF